MKFPTYVTTKALVMALMAATPAAHASIIPTYSINPTTITEGGTGTEILSLQVIADATYYNAIFTGGTVTLNGGNGNIQTFNIIAGQTNEKFNYDFLYPTSGAYTPSWSFVASYSEQYNRYVSQGYWQYYTCGFSECSYWVDTSYYLSGTSYTNTGASGSGSLTVTPVDPVPGPVAGAGLPGLIAACVGLVGMARARRKRNA